MHESSNKIAKTIQPLLLELENGMRGALGNYFLKANGISWWEEVASTSLKKKIEDRSVLIQLNPLLSANLTLTDAHDLGELIGATDLTDFASEWSKAIDLKNKLDFQYPFTQRDLSEAKELTKNVKEIIKQLKI